MAKRKKSIMEFSDGAILERIDKEYAKVLANIADINTDAIKPRTITVTLRVQADHERKNPTITVVTASKLQPTNPVKVNLFDTKMADEKTGEVVYVQRELSGLADGQLNLDGEIHEPEYYVPQEFKS